VPRRGKAPALLVTAVALAIWLLSGVPVADIAVFLAYEIGFVALPGAALLWAVRGRRPGALATVCLGWPLGSALEILAFSATAAVGVRGLFLAYPVIVVGLSALIIWKRRTPEPDAAVGTPMSSRLMWSAAVAMSLGVIYLALMFLPMVPLPSTQAAVSYSPDFVYQMSKTAEVLYHWPPTNPGLAGVPLPYEWFVFFHMAAVSQVTHLAIPMIALRLDFIPIAFVLGCQLLMAGRAISGSAWTGVLAIVVVFLLGPLDLTTDTRAAPAFFSVLSGQLWGSWTFLFGLIFFVPLLWVTARVVRPRTASGGFGAGFWAMCALLMIGAAGAKATTLPVLLTGTALYIVIARVARRAIPRAALALVGLEIVIFVVTFLIIYRGGAAGTGVDPLASLARTFPVIDVHNLGLPAAILAVVLPLAYVAGLAGMLMPLVGMLYLFRRRHRDALWRHMVCVCMLVSGVVIANVFHQTGYSELYFQATGYVAGAVAAAAGMRLAWLDAGTAISFSRRSVVVALAGWIAVLVVLAIVTAFTLRNTPAEVTTYSCLGLGCIVFIVARRLGARIRGHAVSGLLALGLIPLLAASLLTSPIELEPTLARVVTGKPITPTKPDPQKVRGLTPQLLAALDWLQDNSPLNSVIAVSNHWIDPADSDGRYYYYSAFSERQVFVEGYDPGRYEINTDVRSPAGADFAQRVTLNNEVFDSADIVALSILTQQYAVRYLLIDRLDDDHDADDPAVATLGKVVFSNSDAIIVAVGSG
jgi:hypothetical protein